MREHSITFACAARKELVEHVGAKKTIDPDEPLVV
jgi:hypothetical protein